jgi:YidC/Oxa1 family membrane protein insertase
VAPSSADFLFIPDLTDEASGAVLVVLLVLYVGSQLLSSLLMPSTVDRTQRLVFLALPFLFVPFIISFPAGLILYWITTNLWTVVQQVALRRFIGAPITPAATGGATSPGGGILGGLLNRGGGGDGGRDGRDGDRARADGDGAAVRNGAGRGRERARGGAVSAGRAAGRERGSAEGEGGGGAARAAGGPPPPPPRKRKKRSGRRR